MTMSSRKNVRDNFDLCSPEFFSEEPELLFEVFDDLDHDREDEWSTIQSPLSRPGWVDPAPGVLVELGFEEEDLEGLSFHQRSSLLASYDF